MALIFLLPSGLAADDALRPVDVKVIGTAFQVGLANGERRESDRLVGTVLSVEDANRGVNLIRIDHVLLDPRDPEHEITLYKLSVWNAQSGSWENLCSPDADGFAGGFPLSGTWTRAGEHRASDHAFALTCTFGANAKCVRMGYKPWKTLADGTPLWDLHQACTRMLRADYCGDGKAHTRDGTFVDVYDTLGQALTDETGLSLEAVWGPDGAVCVRKPRIPELISLDALLATCPARLKGRVGDDCNEAEFIGSAVPLIFNRS